MFLLVLLTVNLALQPEDEDVLASVVRDAQLANRDKLIQGRSRVEILYSPREPREMDAPIRIVGSVVWKKDASLSKFRCFEPKPYFVFSLAPRTTPDETEEQLLSTPQGVVLTNFGARRVAVHGRLEAYWDHTRLLHFNPRILWFYPPAYGLGIDRPCWEMVGLKLPGSKLRIERIGSNLVKQVREDQDGGVLTILYDLEFAGLPVQSNYQDSPSRPSRQFEIGNQIKEYTWKKSQGIVYPTKIRYHAQKRKSNAQAEAYELRVLEVDFSPVDESSLDLKRYLSRLPADVLIDDRINNRVVPPRSRVGAADVDVRLDALSRSLSSQGFLQNTERPPSR